MMEVRRQSPEVGDSLLSLELAGRTWLRQRQQRGEQKGRSGHFPGDPVADNAPCNAGDVGATPSQGTRSQMLGVRPEAANTYS